MSDQYRDDETRPLPVDDIQRLPVDDGTRQPDADATRPLENEAGGTRRLPIHDDTRRSQDPLSVFDEPRPTATDPAAPAGHAEAMGEAMAENGPARSGPRTATIVWGFLVLALGLGLVADAAGAQIDVELAAIVLLALAGLVLVLGSVVSAARRRRS